MRAFLIAMASAVAVSGCAAQMQADKMEKALSPYSGKSIADFALDHGPPANTIDMGNNKRGFQWVKTAQSPAAIVPLYGGTLVGVPSHQQTCTVALVASTTKPSPALSDWIIESWRWNGEC